jgi:hypothetical protein
MLSYQLRDDHHNENPKPFSWTAKAADILEKANAPAPPFI